MVAAQDQVIPPDAERAFAQRMRATTEEVQSSHVIMVSHPDRKGDASRAGDRQAADEVAVWPGMPRHTGPLSDWRSYDRFPSD
jgi:hypothetical protein